MKTPLSRRQWTAAVLGAAAAYPQTPPAAQPAAAEDLGAVARQQVRRNSELLAKHAIPMATEPAFVFRP